MSGSSRVVWALAIGVSVALAPAGSAGAATKHGITPLAPRAGTSVPAGAAPLFRVRSRGPGQVWIDVCKTKKTNRDGVLCMRRSGSAAVFTGEEIGRARKRSGVFEYRPKVYGFPKFWLNSPGTYYWQAHRVFCNASDCRQEGPIVRFKVS